MADKIHTHSWFINYYLYFSGEQSLQKF